MSKERFEQWGYESFKDNKTGEITNDFLGVMNKQDQKITDLESKLAEKDQELNDICQNYDFQINDFSREVYRLQKREKILEQQLTEKDKEIARLKLLVDGFDKLKQYDKDADLILINPKTCYTDGKELVIKSERR